MESIHQAKETKSSYCRKRSRKLWWHQIHLELKWPYILTLSSPLFDLAHPFSSFFLHFRHRLQSASCCFLCRYRTIQCFLSLYVIDLNLLVADEWLIMIVNRFLPLFCAVFLLLSSFYPTVSFFPLLPLFFLQFRSFNCVCASVQSSIRSYSMLNAIIWFVNFLAHSFISLAKQFKWFIQANRLYSLQNVMHI